MIGAMIGSFCMGMVSDNFGRLKAIGLSLMCMGLPGIISALWVNKPIYREKLCSRLNILNFRFLRLQMKMLKNEVQNHLSQF